MKKIEHLFTSYKLGIIMYGVYYISYLMDTTTLGIDYSLLDKLSQLARYICYFYFIVAICMRIKKIGIKSLLTRVQSFNKKQKLLCLLSALAILSTAANFILTRDKTMMILVIVLIYMSVYSIDHIISMEVALQFLSLIVIVTLCSLNLTTNFINYRSDGGVRYSLGYSYPTNLSQIVMFIMLYGGYRNKFKFSLKEIGIAQIVTVFMYFITDSRTEFLVCELIVLVVICNKYGITNKLKGILKVIEGLFVHLFPLYPLGSLVLPLAYGYVFKNYKSASFILRLFNKINSILTNRVYQTWYDFEFHGFSLFGSNVELVGNGIKSVNKFGVIRSNFIDNEYMNILFSRGALVFVLFLILTFITLIYLYKNQKHDLLFISFIILTFGLMNPRIMNIVYSVFMFIVVYVVKSILFEGERKNGTV